jgi:hypothetical protein
MRSIYKFLPCITALLITAGAVAQGVDQAKSNIRKQKWDKAYGQLQKAMTKDSLNTSAAYVLADYFFTPANPAYQLDSAYHYVQHALVDFQKTTIKQRERLKRFPVDSLVLVRLRQQIDSAAFVRARTVHTERAYVEFIAHFTTAQQRDEAAGLRDEVAYQDALLQNTHQVFAAYLDRYPQSSRARDARARYDRLFFESATQDQRLASYKTFLKNHPDTPHRREAEQNIFQLSTAAGSIESYDDFLRDYPESAFAGKARNILFHLLPEEQREGKFMSDSLLAVIDLEHNYLVPFLHAGQFGFMDKDGREIISAGMDELANDYRCGHVTDDVLLLPHKVVALNGAVIANETALSIEDIGAGFLLMEKEGCSTVIHKTGFAVGDNCIDDAKILNGKIVAVKKDNQWSAWTLTGLRLLPYAWDEINAVKDVIVLKKQASFTLATIDHIAACAEQRQPVNGNEYQDVKPWPGNKVAVSTTEGPGVVDQSLRNYIRPGRQTLAPTYFGALLTRESGTHTVNVAGETSVAFHRVIVQEPWTAVHDGVAWRLFAPATMTYQSPPFDSVAFAGPFALGMKKDSLRIYFSPRRQITLPQPVRAEFVPGQDSSRFLMVEQGDKKTLYDGSGKKLFTTSLERIQHAGEGFFVVHKRDKKGLLGADGKPVLPVEYDAIGSMSGGIVSLLKATKFGLFDCRRRKLIAPVYSKNLTPYNDKMVVAYKNGAYGFVDWDGKALDPLAFTEVRYWNDTAAFVKKGGHWMVYETRTGQVLLDNISTYKLIQDRPGEKLAIVQRDRRYGVINSRKGTVIPMTFSDIINVGSPGEPLYFTEKHVEEASIFVVIYYTAGGKMLRKEVYEQDDYDRIYCSDN